jgi:hypothetical protein
LLENNFFNEIMDIMYNNSINIRFGGVCVRILEAEKCSENIVQVKLVCMQLWYMKKNSGSLKICCFSWPFLVTDSLSNLLSICYLE